MKVLDANVLLHADNKSSEQHDIARHWLLAALVGTESLVIPWISSLAYLRISTQPRALPRPLTVAQAMDFLRPMLSNPRVITGEPDQHHLERVEALLAATGRGGNLVNDAHLAALALQYEATVVSFDNDFSRFPRVRWERPTLIADD
jgi:toxin-antitoxin system PIN domain toxin